MIDDRSHVGNADKVAIPTMQALRRILSRESLAQSALAGDYSRSIPRNKLRKRSVLRRQCPPF